MSGTRRFEALGILKTIRKKGEWKTHGKRNSEMLWMREDSSRLG
jgi:hypothetical protein